MLLHENDTETFKRWVLPKLAISDADSDVLADYVVALVTVDEPEVDVKRNCLHNLSDFLQDYTVPFVNDVLKALKDKSYARSPSKTKTSNSQTVSENNTAPIPSIVGTSNAEYEPNPSRGHNIPPAGAPTGPAATRAFNSQSYASEAHAHRKRKLVEDVGSQRLGRDPHYSSMGGSGRPLKQHAHGGNGVGKNVFGSLEPQNGIAQFLPPLPANFPPPPPGAPPLALLAMLTAFNQGLPPPSLPLSHLQKTPQHGKQPCQDYHTKGVCALGLLCPFDHGDAVLGKVPEYDPERSFLAVQPDRETSGKKKKTLRPKTGGRSRAEFSLPGPSFDPTNTTLVVEQIPKADFKAEKIQEFFSQFGSILEISMHGHRRLVVIKFEDHETAQRAYSSPTAVFDNRFVKVYWHTSDSEPGRPQGVFGDVDMKDGEEEEEKLDLEEIAKRQALAQTAFEERRKKIKDVDTRAEEVEKKLKVKDDEIRDIRKQLAALSADELDASQSLETLQAEAANLFAQHDGPEVYERGQNTPRGGYRGRGQSSFMLRGRGYSSFRGGFQGRGAFSPFVNGRSSVKRLDNRPRRLAISPIEPESSKDEALRQHLINVPDCTDIDRHPEEENTLILSFKERYQAEIFIDSSITIPELGHVTLAWVPNNAFGGIKSANADSAHTNDTDSDTTVPEHDKSGGNGGGGSGGDGRGVTGDNDNAAAAAANPNNGSHDNGTDADMDVADDIDHWR